MSVSVCSAIEPKWKYLLSELLSFQNLRYLNGDQIMRQIANVLTLLIYCDYYGKHSNDNANTDSSSLLLPNNILPKLSQLYVRGESSWFSETFLKLLLQRTPHLNTFSFCSTEDIFTKVYTRNNFSVLLNNH
jgi:hypothetical protein